MYELLNVFPHNSILKSKSSGPDIERGNIASVAKLENPVSIANSLTVVRERERREREKERERERGERDRGEREERERERERDIL